VLIGVDTVAALKKEKKPFFIAKLSIAGDGLGRKKDAISGGYWYIGCECIGCSNGGGCWYIGGGYGCGYIGYEHGDCSNGGGGGGGVYSGCGYTPATATTAAPYLD
jgi:hypothetical protein